MMYIRVLCRERDGVHLRVVRDAPRDPSYIWELYDQVKDIPNFVTADPTKLTPESMLWLFLPSVRVYLVDDVGALVLKKHAEGRADVHITFWDRRLRGRELLARRAALRAMLDEGLYSLETHIPRASRATLAFARRVGFMPETTADDAICKLVFVA